MAFVMALGVGARLSCEHAWLGRPPGKLSSLHNFFAMTLCCVFGCPLSGTDGIARIRLHIVRAFTHSGMLEDREAAGSPGFGKGPVPYSHGFGKA